jgi:hypothetical protein
LNAKPRSCACSCQILQQPQVGLAYKSIIATFWADATESVLSAEHDARNIMATIENSVSQRLPKNRDLLMEFLLIRV